MMKLKLALAPTLILGLLAVNAAADQGLLLHEGTPVRMKINRTVSSGTAQDGENVDFETLDDVKVKDTVVIPRGSIAIATVTEAVPKGRMGKGGKLNMNVDYVRMPNDDKLALRGVQTVRGGGHVGVMAGHEVTVYTSSDYKPVVRAQEKPVSTMCRLRHL